MSRRQLVISITLTVVSSLAISIFLVYRYDTVPERYVPGFTVMAMGYLFGCLMIAAVGLLIFRRTRWAGVLTLAAALLIPRLFNAGVRMSRSEGWIVSANNQANNPLLKAARPKAKAPLETNEIVYYKPGVTKAQMKSFEQAVLYRPQPDGTGSRLNPGITYFRRFGPSQAHGHDGFAIGIAGMSIPAREQLRNSLSESPLVFGLLHDQALDNVPVR